MDKNKNRVIIKFFFIWKEKLQRKSNWSWMLFLGIHHLNFSQWVFGFWNSSIHTSDESRSKCPKTAHITNCK